MPEYACEPESGYLDQPLEPSEKYIENTFACWRMYQFLHGSYMDSSGTYKCCGFLAETPPTEDRPISFYLSIVALVYCVVLTIVFAVWASRHPRNTAVLRRVATRPPPQVVIQNQQV